MAVNISTATATGPAVLRESINVQLDLLKNLFDSLDRLARIAESVADAKQREQLFRELERLKSIGRQLLDNVDRSRGLLPYVS